MKQTGANLQDWVFKEVDEPLEYGDSRSKRINNLLRVGLAAEQMSMRKDIWPDDVEDQEELIVDALECYVEHELNKE